MTLSTPLVISFGGSLRALMRGAITLADLENGLFYFGCEREYFFDEVSARSEVSLENDGVDDGMVVYRGYRALVLTAEANGRAAYREPGQPGSWERLNQLLAGNNLPTIEPWSEDEPDTGRYSYPGVVNAVKEQQLPYNVIWNLR